MKVKKYKWLVVAIALFMVLSIMPIEAVEATGCFECGDEEVKLIAGQNMEVGTVTVTNDNEELCVKYELNEDALEEGWLIYETHLAVGFEKEDIPQTKGNNPIPGQFPYNQSFEEGVEEWRECISFDDLNIEMGDCLVIAAHAVIKKAECEEFDETAWGQGERFNSKGNWGMYFRYKVCDSENGNGDVVCKEETAWGGDTKGAGKAWWYYFDTTKDAKQTIWAGQNINIGTVTISKPADGKVKIQIEFIDGWGLQDDEESVKIQGYNKFPNKRPPAGQFETYKGDEDNVTVDFYKYYAIHLDVQYCTEK